MGLLRNHSFHRRNNGYHCRTRTYVQPLTGRNALPLCQGGGLRDLQFKSYRVCYGDRNKSITYKRKDRNNFSIYRYIGIWGYVSLVPRLSGFMAYINQAPMRIGMEDPWALTELAKAGGSGGGRGPPPA